jgi:thioredoxin 1
MSRETTDANFKQDVLDSTVPVLVDFWAPWCGPCRIAGPIIDRVAQKAGESVRVFKLNVDDNMQTAQQYGITGIPTVMIFKNGKVDQMLVGLREEAVYMKALGVIVNEPVPALEPITQ